MGFWKPFARQLFHNTVTHPTYLRTQKKRMNENEKLGGYF